MKFIDDLKKLLANAGTVPRLASFDQVQLHVPRTAQYVTVSTVAVINDPASAVMSLDTHRYSIASTAADEGRQLEPAYMLHDGQQLMLINENGIPLLTVPLNDITILHRSNGGGFALHLRDGRGIACSTPTPVQSPPEAWYRTVSGMTDMTSGWLAELEPHGTRVDH